MNSLPSSPSGSPMKPFKMDAILRRVDSGCPPSQIFSAPSCDVGPLKSPVDMYVDDSFGAGRADHVRVARDRVVLVSEGVLAPGSAISKDKSVLAPAADILGYHVDCTTATIRPRDRAIDKLFFVLFSFNSAEPQPLVLWQCIASLVNMYSHVIRGMRPFVAALIHMTCRASGHHNQRATATSSAVFALEMWRAAIVLLVGNRTCLSVSLDIFLLSFGLQSLLWKVVSDASPWRLAAGLYDYQTGRLLCWTTLLLPYSTTNAHRFQTQREYLGHLLSLLLINAYRARLSSPPLGTLSYQWVNDNTGAIAWVNTHKCSSPSSLFACMAVSQLNLVTNVWAADAVHIPGETMGEIDAMSRLETQSDPLTAFPTLTPDMFLSLQSPQLLELFVQCDPALAASAPAEHHVIFSTVSTLIPLPPVPTGSLSGVTVLQSAAHLNPDRFHTMRRLLNQAQQSVANSIQVFGTDPFMSTVPPEFSQYQSEADCFHHTSWQEACFMGFLEWLQCPPKPIAPDTAYNYLYAVKHHLASHGLVMDSLVSSVIIAKQKKGNRNTFLAHENNLEADKRTLPLSVDILMAERPREGSKNPLQDLAFFTALLLGFTMLTR
eukprot:gene34929-45208_t